MDHGKGHGTQQQGRPCNSHDHSPVYHVHHRPQPVCVICKSRDSCERFAVREEWRLVYGGGWVWPVEGEMRSTAVHKRGVTSHPPARATALALGPPYKTPSPCQGPPPAHPTLAAATRATQTPPLGNPDPVWPLAIVVEAVARAATILHNNTTSSKNIACPDAPRIPGPTATPPRRRRARVRRHRPLVGRVEPYFWLRLRLIPVPWVTALQLVQQPCSRQGRTPRPSRPSSTCPQRMRKARRV